MGIKLNMKCILMCNVCIYKLVLCKHTHSCAKVYELKLCHPIFSFQNKMGHNTQIAHSLQPVFTCTFSHYLWPKISP